MIRFPNIGLCLLQFFKPRATWTLVYRYLGLKRRRVRFKSRIKKSHFYLFIHILVEYLAAVDVPLSWCLEPDAAVICRVAWQFGTVPCCPSNILSRISFIARRSSIINPFHVLSSQQHCTTPSDLSSCYCPLNPKFASHCAPPPKPPPHRTARPAPTTPRLGLTLVAIISHVDIKRGIGKGKGKYAIGHQQPPYPSTPHKPLTPTQQLIREIESQAAAAQQQIGLVRTQMVSKQREMRLVQLTRGEMATLPPDTAVYEGVGKMFVLHLVSWPSLRPC